MRNFGTEIYLTTKMYAIQIAKIFLKMVDRQKIKLFCTGDLARLSMQSSQHSQIEKR